MAHKIVHTKDDRIHGTARMILKRTLLIVLTFVTARRKFITPVHRALISLVLTSLPGAGCARPIVTTVGRAAPLVYVAVGDSTGIGLGARDEQAIHSQPPVESSKRSYPSLTLESIEGRTVRLGDYRGKVVLINFWATWCPPCRAEMPALVKLQQEYGKHGLQIIGITYPPERLERVRKFTRRLKVNYPIVLGTRATKAGFSPDETLPLTVIIDREGTIRGTIAGILLPEEFNLQIKPLLEGRASEGDTNHVQKNK